MTDDRCIQNTGAILRPDEVHIVSSEAKGLTDYCFKYIDRPFCLRIDDIIDCVSTPSKLNNTYMNSSFRLFVQQIIRA